MKKVLTVASIIGAAVIGLTGSIYLLNPTAQTTAVERTQQLSLQVYKSPTCGCCTAWIDHLEQANFKVSATNLNDLDSVKDKYGIGTQLRSCHTGVSADGYAFEGHVPAKYIAKFLSDKPKDAIGLSVPAMPVGSPGMEVDDKFMPYQVLLLKKDGGVEVYAEVKDYASQF